MVSYDPELILAVWIPDIYQKPLNGGSAYSSQKETPILEPRIPEVQESVNFKTVSEFIGDKPVSLRFA
jgi:hypothetical protein